MPFRLHFRLDQRHQRALVGEGELVVGSSEDCGLRLDFPTVSRRHARLRVDGDRLEVEDLGSSNGSWLDGERLRQPTPVAPGQSLRLGEVEVVVELVGEDEASLALELPAPRASPRDADPAGRTLQASGGEARFWRRRLAGLLAEAAAGASRLRLARLVGEAAFEDLDLAGIEIGTDRVGVAAGGADAELLFLAGGPRGEACASASDGLWLQLWPQAGELDGTIAESLLRIVQLGPPAPEAPRDAMPAAADHDGPVSADPVVREIHRRARQVARSPLNVLIRGESGTGKEVLAQLIRDHAGGSGAPFVALNCAALADDLIDAELFGIERGVATGVEARPGKFELAHGGILFLDEVGDMAPGTQARMLRVLQEGEVVRIGGREPRPARVRVVAATNQDLEAMIAEGRFRLDLLHRIADWQVRLPPLRERPADIPLLALRFLDEACRDRGVQLRGISRAAHDALLAYAWPGNIRELQREMARVAVFLGDGDVLSAGDLRQAMQRSGPPPGEDLRSQLEAAERRILQLAVERAAGNMSEAAQKLGIARSTLYRRMEALGLGAGDAEGDGRA